jgi:glycosyltransferase involved in cell wall biosynthesis
MDISIVTACFNSADTLRDALDSVAEQSYQEYEHIVVDGASTDATLDILKRYGGGKVRWHSEPDHGIYDALNKGIARASGEVLGFLHADDVYASDQVLALIAAAFEDPAVDAVYGDLQYVSKHDPKRVVRHWRSSTFKPDLLSKGWMPPHPALYVRRALYERIGGFDTRYRIAADYHSVLQLFSLEDFNAHYIPKVFVKMRLGGASNRSIANIIRKSREDYAVLRRTGVGGIVTLAQKNFGKLRQFRGG